MENKLHCLLMKIMRLKKQFSIVNTFALLKLRKIKNHKKGNKSGPVWLGLSGRLMLLGFNKLLHSIPQKTSPAMARTQFCPILNGIGRQNFPQTGPGPFDRDWVEFMWMKEVTEDPLGEWVLVSLVGRPRPDWGEDNLDYVPPLPGDFVRQPQS